MEDAASSGQASETSAQLNTIDYKSLTERLPRDEPKEEKPEDTVDYKRLREGLPQEEPGDEKPEDTVDYKSLTEKVVNDDSLPSIDVLQERAVSIALDEITGSESSLAAQKWKAARSSEPSNDDTKKGKTKGNEPGKKLEPVNYKNLDGGLLEDESEASVNSAQERAVSVVLNENLDGEESDVMSAEKLKAAGLGEAGDKKGEKKGDTSTTPQPAAPGAFRVRGIDSAEFDTDDVDEFREEPAEETPDQRESEEPTSSAQGSSEMLADDDDIDLALTMAAPLPSLARQANRMVNDRPGVMSIPAPIQPEIRRLNGTPPTEEEETEETEAVAVADPISAEVVEQEEIAREEIQATKEKLHAKLNELNTMTEQLAEMELMRKELAALKAQVGNAVPVEAVVAVPHQEGVKRKAATDRRRSSLEKFSEREIDALHLLLGQESGEELPKRFEKSGDKLLQPSLNRGVSDPLKFPFFKRGTSQDDPAPAKPARIQRGISEPTKPSVYKRGTSRDELSDDANPVAASTPVARDEAVPGTTSREVPKITDRLEPEMIPEGGCCVIL